MLHGLPPLAALICAALVLSQTVYAQKLDTDVKLLFSTSQDVANTWGQLRFGATPMQKIRDCDNPGFSLACCLPQPDGSWRVYGQVFKNGPTETSNSWKLIRATTRDGGRFENVETVFEPEPGPWTAHLGLAYNPDAKEFLALKLRVDDNGFAYRAFFSADGRSWKEHAGNPLFYDGDSMGLFWSPAARRFICSSKTLQPFAKRLQDHGGTHPQNKDDNLRDRRVLAIRSSSDGRTWAPSDSMMNVWNRLDRYKPLPAEQMITPDDGDPPDMEFYRGIGFWYHDRSYLVVLNYAASPLAPRKHGPQLDTEWWVSRDGLVWERPYRGINALGDAFPGVPNITHNPMIIDGMILFHFGAQLFGMKQDRISFAGARANAEFSTRPFQMPQADLYLNAAIPAPDRPFAAQQAYVMADVLDDQGQVVPGFEAEKCVIQRSDRIDLPLRWNGKSARELAGHQISLRFHLRSANIYAVTSGMK
ncbi:MAG: hypothetical protein NTX50_04585 [Candidatus Sumerlaeota bacterium]|nr:hypothetical protein [Candidatus Sumerlaeota bacterium]